MISKARLINFRSFTDFELKLPKNLILLGPNGSGKTSIIESICLTITGKSFKSGIENIVKKDQDYLNIELIGDINNTPSQKIVFYTDLKHKKLTINQKPKRHTLMLKYFPIVLFEPNLFSLFLLNPAQRRKYLDHILITIDQDYSNQLANFNKALVSRNILLKKISRREISKNELLVWDIQYQIFYQTVTKKRRELIDTINSLIEDNYFQITGQKTKLKLNLVTSPQPEVYLEKEIILGYSLFGAHRDDLEILFNNTKLQYLASRGESRSAILALKLIETQIISQSSEQDVIMLLDDVFGELDYAHQQHLMGSINSHQTIITSTHTLAEKLQHGQEVYKLD